MKHKKQISDKKKLGLAAAACAMIGLIAATMAYFSSSHSFTNKFSAAKYSVETYDLFDTEKALDMWPGQTMDASVKVKNTGDVPILVRIKYPVKYKENSLPDPFTIEEAEKTPGSRLGGHYYLKVVFSTNKFLYNDLDNKFYYQGVITEDDGEVEHFNKIIRDYSYLYGENQIGFLQSSGTSEPWNDDSKWKTGYKSNKNFGEFRELGCYPRIYYRFGVYIETIQATDKNGKLLTDTVDFSKATASSLKQYWTNLGK